ncbi:MAG: O-antigen ligase family protein [Crocinitomicaceae bacterium]|nr:O-antigen ligase family protein [Crocinitomicaceae bacterium]
MFIFVLFLGYKTQAVQFYAIGLISIAIFILIKYEQQLRTILKQKRYLFVMVISIGTLMAIAAFNLERLKVLTNFQDRLSSWKIGYDMFINHPFFGVGIENFWNFQGMYKSPEQQRILGDTIIVDKSHNVFIDQFANGGFITGISFICFILATIYFLLRANFSSLSPDNRLYFSLFSAVWAGYVFQLFFSPDNIVEMTIAYSCLAMMMRIASTTDVRAFKSSAHTMYKNSSLVRTTAILLLLPLGVIGYHAINYEVTVRKILLNKIMNGDQIIEVIKSYPNPKGVESIIVHEIDRLDNCPFVNIASDELLKINPRSAQAWYFKTICMDHVGEYEKSLEFANKALETQPITLSYLDAKCRLEARLGKYMEAEVTLAKIKQIFPESTRISELQKLVQVSSTN